jgi:hypothetical protein
MQFDLPHDTPEPTDPKAFIGGRDLIFRDASGFTAVLHRPQLVGIVAEGEPIANWHGTRIVDVASTHYAIVRLNPLPNGRVYVLDTRVRDEPTHIYDVLAKERSL